MAKHGKDRDRRGLKGTDVYLAVICGLVIWYVWFAAEVFKETSSWPPVEITLGVWVLALYEVFSLLRVYLVREGESDKHGIISDATSKAKGWLASKSPIELPDTDIDIQIAKEQMEVSDGAKTDEP